MGDCHYLSNTHTHTQKPNPPKPPTKKAKTKSKKKTKQTKATKTFAVHKILPDIQQTAWRKENLELEEGTY